MPRAHAPNHVQVLPLVGTKHHRPLTAPRIDSFRARARGLVPKLLTKVAYRSNPLDRPPPHRVRFRFPARDTA